MADFSIRLLTDLAEDGKCGLFGSFGPGQLEFAAWDDLVRVLRWIDQHPCGT